MPVTISFADAEARFDSQLALVTDDREIIVIERPGKEAVAMIALSELARLVETVDRSIEDFDGKVKGKVR